jgi:putative flavoprotein involved in K+ transport
VSPHSAPVMDVTAVIIGAGQAGLAASRCLTERSIDHVVLERGEVGNSWRTERWDSLRLLTPNWMNRLPGMPSVAPGRPTARRAASSRLPASAAGRRSSESIGSANAPGALSSPSLGPPSPGAGTVSLRHGTAPSSSSRPLVDDDPDGYMDAAAVATMLRTYARDVEAPVLTRVTVQRVSRTDGGYTVTTDHGTWRAAAVVLASGAANLPSVPALATAIPTGVTQLTPHGYRSPDGLPDGGVLVVGASATGVQLADEIHRSGRPVTLAVGEHVRLPRRHRDRDVMWWLDAAGVLDERWDQVDDLVRARNLPSPQLIGSSDGRDLDLNALTDAGVRLVGRLGGLHDGVAQFSGALANTVALADLKLGRLLRRFDDWGRSVGIDGIDGSADPPPPTRLPDEPTLELDLRRSEVSTILWATGFRPDYRWLDVPALDRRGRIVHEGGVVTGHPGLYVLGTSLLRTRRSNYIAGAGADAAAVTDHLARHLAGSNVPGSNARAGSHHAAADPLPAIAAAVDRHAPAGRPTGPEVVGCAAAYQHTG